MLSVVPIFGEGLDERHPPWSNDQPEQIDHAVVVTHICHRIIRVTLTIPSRGSIQNIPQTSIDPACSTKKLVTICRKSDRRVTEKARRQGAQESSTRIQSKLYMQINRARRYKLLKQ